MQKVGPRRRLRFNRRLSDAIRALPQARNNGRHRTHFIANADRVAFLLTFVENYNRTRLRCLNYKAPLDVLNNQTEYNTEGARGPVVELWWM